MFSWFIEDGCAIPKLFMPCRKTSTHFKYVHDVFKLPFLGLKMFNVHLTNVKHVLNIFNVYLQNVEHIYPKWSTCIQEKSTCIWKLEKKWKLKTNENPMRLIQKSLKSKTKCVEPYQNQAGRFRRSSRYHN